MKTYLKTNHINNDVITTSGTLLFNTIEYRSASQWLFYNVDLTNADNRDYDLLHYFYKTGSANIDDAVGMDDSLKSTYQAIASTNNFSDDTVYHYVNGSWIKCSDHCIFGQTVNHKSNKQLG